jgi:hypothetical protein
MIFIKFTLVMESEILFSENQRFSQWWLWLLLIGINGMMLYGIMQQVIFGKPFGDRPGSDAELFIAGAIAGLILVLFISLKLETRITKEGVYVRFRPFHHSFRYYSWASLSKSYIRKYSPILEYGGWGLRYGFYGKGSALNVSGNKGLQLMTIEGKKMLIGTRMPEEITETLKKLNQLKE